MPSSTYKYFLFSQQQYQLRKEVELKIGRIYIPGKVVANGRWKDYTEISDSPTNNKFADAKVIAEGYLDRMEYKQSTFQWRTRS